MAGRDAVVKIENEAQVRKAFKDLGGAGKDLTKANRVVAKAALALAKAAASGSSDPEQTSAVNAITATATQSAASLRISSGSIPWAIGAFYGAKEFPQFLPWIGNGWDLNEGTGPYAIKFAFSPSGIETIKQTYQKEVGDTLRAAGLSVE